MPTAGECDPREWLREDCQCRAGECSCGRVRVLLGGPEHIRGEPGDRVVMVVRIGQWPSGKAGARAE